MIDLPAKIQALLLAQSGIAALTGASGVRHFASVLPDTWMIDSPILTFDIQPGGEVDAESGEETVSVNARCAAPTSTAAWGLYNALRLAFSENGQNGRGNFDSGGVRWQWVEVGPGTDGYEPETDARLVYATITIQVNPY